VHYHIKTLLNSGGGGAALGDRLSPEVVRSLVGMARVSGSAAAAAPVVAATMGVPAEW
jgi:hypothetical protein